ncbi:hypothetical protein AB4259_09410 [Vibrio amylolyticus]|uniref:hypothetical protein n=1 Tax=Vibrio amylolyticus TaxID=2847292 RepID=UPI00354F8EA6
MFFRLLAMPTAFFLLSIFSSFSYSEDFGVRLEWNIENKKEVLSVNQNHKLLFMGLVERGEVKDVYIQDETKFSNRLSYANFVIEANDETEVREKLSSLPLYKMNALRIKEIKPLGTKWLDNTPAYKNFSLSFYWKENIDSTELNRVLSVDLQRVVALSQSGLITSSYIKAHDSGSGEQTTYLISVLADDKEHALALSEQFESVQKGYVDVSARYLGRKLDFK